MGIVIRSPHIVPAPYLKSISCLFDKIIDKTDGVRCIDLGCGNGRNSKYMSSLGVDVVSFDIKDDYGYYLDIEKRRIPIFINSTNIFLLQYILMFIHHRHLDTIIKDICIKSKRDNAIVIIELCQVKSGYYYDLMNSLKTSVIKFFQKGGFKYCKFCKNTKNHFVLTNNKCLWV